MGPSLGQVGILSTEYPSPAGPQLAGRQRCPEVRVRQGARPAQGSGKRERLVAWDGEFREGGEPSQRVKVQNSFHSSRFSVVTQQPCPLAPWP